MERGQAAAAAAALDGHSINIQLVCVLCTISLSRNWAQDAIIAANSRRSDNAIGHTAPVLRKIMLSLPPVRECVLDASEHCTELIQCKFDVISHSLDARD